MTRFFRFCFWVCCVFLFFDGMCVYANENEGADKVSVGAKTALLYDVSFDKVLYEKNVDVRIPNASTTKILTAIVAYENSSMDDVVEISARAAGIGGSTINLRKGNKVKMGDLMKGLLMSSGNDAAIAIAEHVGGSVEGFCDMMNERARSFGAMNTNFVTPHGLDRDEHYTTALDMLIFTKYFMGIQYLMEITNTEKTTILIDNYEKDLKNTNEMLEVFDETNGIKTGFTGKAGRCLITSVSSGDRVLVSMVFGCDSKNQRTEDTIKLISYGYDEFEVVDIFENMKKNFEIRVKKSINSGYEIIVSGSRKMLIRKGSKDKIWYEYDVNYDLIAPVLRGQNVGSIRIGVGEDLLAEVMINVPYDIKKKTFYNYFGEIFENQKEYTEVVS